MATRRRQKTPTRAASRRTAKAPKSTRTRKAASEASRQAGTRTRSRKAVRPRSTGRRSALARSASEAPVRKARTAAPAMARKNTGARAQATGQRARRGSTLAAVASLRLRSCVAASWPTLRLVCGPAIAMATLPYRVYRVYRWAEAASLSSCGASPH